MTVFALLTWLIEILNFYDIYMMIYPVMSFDALIAGSQLSTQNYNSLYIKILV